MTAREQLKLGSLKAKTQLPVKIRSKFLSAITVDLFAFNEPDSALKAGTRSVYAFVNVVAIGYARFQRGRAGLKFQEFMSSTLVRGIYIAIAANANYGILKWTFHCTHVV